MSSSCCGVCVEGAVFWKEGRKGPGKGRSPAAARAPLLGPGVSPAASSTACPTMLDGTGVTQVQFLPYSESGGSRLWRHGSPSTLPSWTHEVTSLHARGRDRSHEERRARYLNSGGDEAPFGSGVPHHHHHTPPALAVQHPCSLTHPLPSGARWRAANKGVVVMLRGEAADSSQDRYIDR